MGLLATIKGKLKYGFMARNYFVTSSPSIRKREREGWCCVCPGRWGWWRVVRGVCGGGRMSVGGESGSSSVTHPVKAVFDSSHLMRQVKHFLRYNGLVMVVLLPLGCHV